MHFLLRWCGKRSTHTYEENKSAISIMCVERSVMYKMRESEREGDKATHTEKKSRRDRPQKISFLVYTHEESTMMVI